MFNHMQVIGDGLVYPSGCKAKPQGEVLLK